jgi:hypothetical protein
MKLRAVFFGGPFLLLAVTINANAQIRSGIPAVTPLPPSPPTIPSTPYPMTYSDEAARMLGLKNGHLDVFTVKPKKNTILPELSGGVGRDGAMVKLQWHPGE